MRRRITAIAVGIGIAVGTLIYSCLPTHEEITIETAIETTAVEMQMTPHVVLAMEPEEDDIFAVEPSIEPETEAEVESDILSKEEIELIALVTMAEAEGEPEHGQRLVISTILNRVDHASFPDTVHGVIYQKNAFSSMWDGRANRCSVREDFVELVRDELENRTDANPIYFRTGHYSKYGNPLYQVGDHYFSSF